MEEEQGGNKVAVHGQGLLKTLSKELTTEFGKGFSYANLRNFRQFYLTYPDWSNCYTLCSNLSWSHNRLIMRILDSKARSYYLTEAAAQNWNVRETERAIRTKHYERLLSSQNIQSKSGESKNKLEFIKDPYLFDFLNIPQLDNFSEKKSAFCK